MKNRPSQKELVLKQLRNNGVSRNKCISGEYGMIITRLSEYINQFRKYGMDIETKETTNPRETVYILNDKPKSIERFEVKNNKGEVEKVIERVVW